MKSFLKNGKKFTFTVLAVMITSVCVIIAVVTFNNLRTKDGTADGEITKNGAVSGNSDIMNSGKNDGSEAEQPLAVDKIETGTGAISSQKTVVDPKLIIPIKFVYEANYWEKYNLSNAVYKTKEEYESAVIDYLVRIASFTGKPDWYNQYMGKGSLEIRLSIIADDDFDGLSMIEGPRNDKTTSFGYTIYLSKSMFEHKNVALADALSYMLNYSKNNRHDSFSDSLTIGLNHYIQYNLGDKMATCSSGVDIHNYLIEFTKRNISDPKNVSSMNLAKKNIGGIGMTSYGTGQAMPNIYQRLKSIKTTVTSNGAEIANSSVFSLKYNELCYFSFVDYLIRKYGIDAFMTMYNGNDITVYNAFHANGISGIRSDWLKFLDEYSCKMSMDEIDAYIAQQRASLGY